MSNFLGSSHIVDRHINHDDHERIQGALVGRKVTKVADDVLALDDGTRLRVVANEGCGGCSNGYYGLERLAEIDNIITRVDPVEDEERTDLDYPEDAHRYRLFVYADNERINLVQVAGDDGNGYYGTGFDFVIEEATS